MPEPYRTPPSPQAPGEPRSCDLCGRGFVPAAEEVDVCATCLLKASRAAQRIENVEKEKKQGGVATRLRRSLPAVLFGLYCFGMVGVPLFMGGAILTQTAELRRAMQLREHKPDRARDRARERARDRARQHKDQVVQQAEPPRAAPPPVQAIPPPAQDIDLPAIPSVLSSLVPQTHDPDALLDKAKRLRQAGLDIMLMRTEIQESALDAAFSSFNSRISPVVVNGRNVGLRVTRIGPISLASLAGFQNGDVILSINGYDVSSPEYALHGYESARHKKGGVVELIREGRRVVLDIRVL